MKNTTPFRFMMVLIPLCAYQWGFISQIITIMLSPMGIIGEVLKHLMIGIMLIVFLDTLIEYVYVIVKLLQKEEKHAEEQKP